MFTIQNPTHSLRGLESITTVKNSSTIRQLSLFATESYNEYNFFLFLG